MMQSNTNIASEDSDVSSFSELGLPGRLTVAYKELGYNKPTPIQRATIVHGLQGKDIIAQSKAGTGKTLAFLSIVINKIFVGYETLQALILLPTRELALQVYDVASRIVKNIPEEPKIKIALMIGGIPIQDDRNALRQKVHLVIGTIGRIHGLVKEKAMRLDEVKTLVLDEADKLIDAHGMKDQLKYLYERIERNTPQVLSFSATYNQECFAAIKELGYSHVFVRLSGEKDDTIGHEQESKIDINVQTLEQYYCKVKRNEDDKVGVNTLKSRLVVKILKEVKYDQAIIFYNDKGLGEDLESDLREEGISLHFIHGDQTQAERIRIMNKLKLKRVNVILATDLLSRGIDIEHISLVINFDIPRSMETYFHRVGRTGRFGKYGVSIIFLTELDEGFILNNKEYFVNIKELPEDLGGINNFIARNEEEGKVKPFKPVKGDEKEDFATGIQGQISDWKEVDHSFYDEAQYKYFEENVEESKGEIIPEEEGEEYVDDEAFNEHLHNDDYWGFLKCRVCYEFLIQSEQQLGRKFEILQHFQIEGVQSQKCSEAMNLEEDKL